jgi:hypothetical protein
MEQQDVSTRTEVAPCPGPLVNTLGLLGGVIEDIDEPKRSEVRAATDWLIERVHFLTGIAVTDLNHAVIHLAKQESLDGHLSGGLAEAYFGAKQALNYIALPLRGLDTDGTTAKLWRGVCLRSPTFLHVYLAACRLNGVPTQARAETTDVAAQKPRMRAAMTQPPANAIAAYRTSLVVGGNQSELADFLSKELGQTVTQGQVSRWLAQVKAFLEAGNVLPEMPTAPPESSIDPKLIELGSRMDGKARRQRERRRE